MVLACNLALELRDLLVPAVLQLLTCIYQHVIVRQLQLACHSHAVVYITLLIAHDGCLYTCWKP